MNEASKVMLPDARGLYYGGAWHEAMSGVTVDVLSPATGERLCAIADGGASDVDHAVTAAREGFKVWRAVPPLERGRILREAAAILRRNGRELAALDAIDGGNPVTEMGGDVAIAAAQMEFFAGLVTEMKGHSIPMGPDAVNFSVREPRGVVARIIPFNHPFMFCAGKSAVNEVSKHFLGTPFGGFKQSGLGREECLEELLAFTQEKNIHIRFKAA